MLTFTAEKLTKLTFTGSRGSVRPLVAEKTAIEHQRSTVCISFAYMPILPSSRIALGSCDAIVK